LKSRRRTRAVLGEKESRMKNRSLVIAFVATSTVCAFAVSAHGQRQPMSSQQRAESTAFSDELAVYLGCGKPRGPGAVYQLDSAGKVLGSVALSGTPYGLAAEKERLVAALPALAGAKMMKIDSTGKPDVLFEERELLPAPITVAVTPGTHEVVVGDNRKDVVIFLPDSKHQDRLPILDVSGDAGARKFLQNMSLAITSDHFVLFGTDHPRGIYRFTLPRGDELRLLNQQTQVLRDDGEVASDPSSKRWAAALRSDLKVFEESRELATIPYPGGTLKTILPLVAFGPDGTLILTVGTGPDKYDVMRADLATKSLRSLFTWNKASVKSLAVMQRMTWKEK
jgi:hypothetical protein